MPEEIPSPEAIGSAPSKPGGIFVWLRNKLILGLFVVFPLFLTVIVFEFIYDKVSSICDPFVRHFVASTQESLPAWIPLVETPKGLTIPGAGLFLTLLLLVILGFIASNFLGKRLVRGIDRLLLNLPVVKTVYNLAKQLVEAFQGMTEPGGFAEKQVVYVKYPGSDGYIIGFLTNKFKDAQGETRCVVFIPTAPNPITGFVLIFHEKDVLLSDLTMDHAWKMIVSAGLMTPRKVTGQIRPIASTK